MTDEVDTGSDIAQTPPGGMLSGIKKETAPHQETPPPQQDNQWYWDDGRPGEGERPSWLEPKFKSVADKARAHSEAEKELGSLRRNGDKAPDSYDLSAYQDKINPEDTYMQRFMENARKARMSQENFSEMLNTLVEYETSKMPNIDEEIKKLGPNANEKIETVKRWAANNLSQEACDVLGQIGNRAEVINFIDEIRQLQLHQASQPPGAGDPSEGFVRMTLEDWQEELAIPANQQKYLEDPKYRAQMSAKLKLIMGEE